MNRKWPRFANHRQAIFYTIIFLLLNLGAINGMNADLQPEPDGSGKPPLSAGSPVDEIVITTNQSGQDLTSAVTTQTGDPNITLWYGLNQSFAQIGEPQPWVNVLGNVSGPNNISSLTYSVNDIQSNLSMGPDNQRLVESGDFNIEISYDDLTAGANNVVITATDSLSSVTVITGTVNYSAGNTWPESYAVDWSGVTDIQYVAQIVDGQWVIQADSLRTLVAGYDRLVAIGDLSWTDYELTVPITIHGITADAFDWPSNGAGVGFVTRWQGHLQEGREQPGIGWQNLGALAWHRWYKDGSDIISGLQMLGYSPPGGYTELTVNPDRQLDFSVPYMYKMSVQSVQGGGDTYRFKVWEVGQPEPYTWDMIAQGHPDEPESGSILLAAHEADASFGDVTIKPLSAIRPTLIVSQPENGSIMVEPEQVDYTYGQVVTITAVADPGYMLDTWGGSLSGSGNPVTLTMAGDQVVSSTFAEAADPKSDDFNACVLDSSRWTVIDPVGDVTVETNGRQLSIAVPAGVSHNLWTGENDAPRVMESAQNSDFEIEVKFESALSEQYQMQGIIVEADSNNFLRFDFYDDGNAPGTLKIFAASFSGGTATPINDLEISAGNPLFMKIRRSGNTWTQYYSYNGTSWTIAKSFSHALVVTAAGVFAGNAGTDVPTHTAVIDYFFNTGAPILLEDNDPYMPLINVVGNGSVIRSPNKSTYACGESITLTAVDDPGWSFTSWGGAASGTNKTITIQFTVGEIITATFVNEYKLFLPLIVNSQ